MIWQGFFSGDKLVGHSVGGLVSSQTAMENPARVASLFLICTAGLGDEINTDYIDGFISSAKRKDLKSMLQTLFADQSLVSRSMVDELLKYKRLDGVQSFLEMLNSNLFAEGRQCAKVASNLSSLDCPIHIVWGEKDAVIPQSHANAISGANVSIIEGAGHMVQMEEASKVNEIIKAQL